MIAEPIERRSSKRFAVETDCAEVVVVLDGSDHRAVMADISASGFGLLFLKGSRIAPGHIVRLIGSDSDTDFDLEVVHIRPEESFQYVGLRRISDRTRLTVPLFRAAGKTFDLKMPAASPLIFVGVVFGFSGMCIGLVEMIRDIDNGPRSQNMTVSQRASASSGKLSPEDKRAHLLERSQRSRTRLVKPRLEDQVGRLVGNSDITWSQLVAQLGLSRTQQDGILGLLNSSDDSKIEAARTQMMNLLTADQRSAFNQLLAALPLN